MDKMYFNIPDLIIVSKRVNHSKSKGKETYTEFIFYKSYKAAESSFWDLKKQLENTCTMSNYSGEVCMYHPMTNHTGELIKNIKNSKNVIMSYCVEL